MIHQTRTLAVRVAKFGGPDVLSLEETLVPLPGPNAVLLHVHAAGVGPWDAWIRSGKSVIDQPLPLTLGSDVAGVVTAVGESVTHLKAGDEVYGVTNERFTGGYAQYALCDADRLALKPKLLSYVEAASVPVVAVTAWQLLFKSAGLTAGRSVVIHGAAGAVGRYAVQLAKAANLTVVATARAGEAEMLRALGADDVVDLTAPNGLQVDAAIDLVGGETQALLFDLIADGGAFYSAVSPPDVRLAQARSIRSGFMLVDVRTQVLDKLTPQFEDGDLVPFVGAVLPLSDAQTAHRMLDGEITRPAGKIVLEID